MSVKSPRPQSGETVALSITSLDPKGCGLSALDGRTVRVPGTLPGEQVSAEVLYVRKGQVHTRLLSVAQPDANRVTPRCPHFGPCGGCDLQHVSDAAQLVWKRQRLEEIFRAAGLTIPKDVEVTAGKSSWGYRGKLELTFSGTADAITLGFHERGSFNRIVDVSECHIAPEPVPALIQAVRKIVNQLDAAPYHPRRHEGFWRHLVVRTAQTTGKMMVMVMTADGPEALVRTLQEQLCADFPDLESFYWGISNSLSDVAIPERLIKMAGAATLGDQVGSVQFEWGPTQFVQPNLAVAAVAYQAIAEAADLDGSQAVYDLYCGIGLMALAMAPQARMVYGVESESQNIAAAQKNAEQNGIENVLFMEGRVEDLVKHQTLFKAGLKPDLIILDPPRVGLHPDVHVPVLLADAPMIAYLSCNPVSLARDLKTLCDRDNRYHINKLHLFDFFPHTAHMETLAILRRA